MKNIILDIFVRNVVHMSSEEFEKYLKTLTLTSVNMVTFNILEVLFYLKTIATYYSYNDLLGLTKKMHMFVKYKLSLKSTSEFEKLDTFNASLLEMCERYRLNGYLTIVDSQFEYFITVKELSENNLVNQSMRKVRLVNRALDKYFIKDLSWTIKQYLF